MAVVLVLIDAGFVVGFWPYRAGLDAFAVQHSRAIGVGGAHETRQDLRADRLAVIQQHAVPRVLGTVTELVLAVVPGVDLAAPRTRRRRARAPLADAAKLACSSNCGNNSRSDRDHAITLKDQWPDC